MNYNKVFISFYSLSFITLSVLFFLPKPKDNIELQENRKKAEFPIWSESLPNGSLSNRVKNYFQGLEAFIDDNFIIKGICFDIFRDIHYGVFNVDPLPNKAIKGKEGFYFLGNDYSDIVKETLGLSLYSHQKKQQIVKKIKRIKRFCDSQNIEFYLAIAPNKQSIYSEFLPIKNLKKNQSRKVDQIIGALKKSDVNIVYMGDGFKKNKHIRMFDKTDSHWNSYGAFLGYSNLMKNINSTFPNINACSINDFKFQTSSSYQEDITRMLDLNIFERKIGLKRKGGWSYKKEREKVLNYNCEKYVNPSKKYKVTLFVDSFGGGFKRYIAQTFNTTYSFRSIPKKAIIKELKPDIIIFELVERNLEAINSFGI